MLWASIHELVGCPSWSCRDDRIRYIRSSCLAVQFPFRYAPASRLCAVARKSGTVLDITVRNVSDTKGGLVCVGQVAPKRRSGKPVLTRLSSAVLLRPRFIL